jgi:hypothetical protein
MVQVVPFAKVIEYRQIALANQVISMIIVQLFVKFVLFDALPVVI